MKFSSDEDMYSSAPTGYATSLVGRINRWTARFESDSLEQLYRQEFLVQDKKRFKVVISIIIILIVGLMYLDFQLVDSKAVLTGLVACRTIATIFLLWLYRICRKTDNPKVIDRSLLAAILVCCLFVFLINMTRPADYYFYFPVDLITIIIVYIYVPNRLVFQVVPAFVYSGLEVVIFYGFRDYPGPAGEITFWSSLLLANFIGFFTTYGFHIAHRRNFSLWIVERELKDSLRHALSEIKTLSGMLPICSCCKKIRDDKGYWNQIECYISEHSDAVFTHGLCPECAEKLYPDYTK